MKATETAVFEFEALECFAPFAINGDVGDLSEDEVEQWKAHESCLLEEFGGDFCAVITDCGESAGFGRCEVTGLGGDLVPFTVTVIL